MRMWELEARASSHGMGKEGTEFMSYRACAIAFPMSTLVLALIRYAGKSISEVDAEEVGSASISDAKPLTHNTYLVQIAKTMVKRAILACK